MENYITIPEAFNALDLSLPEKVTLALINGYSQGEQGVFYGTISFIQQWLGCTNKTAIATLKKLVDKGYLEKTSINIDHHARVAYRVVYARLGEVEAAPEEGEESECKNYTRQSVKITPSECKNYTRQSVKITLDPYLKERDIKRKKEERKKETPAPSSCGQRPSEQQPSNSGNKSQFVVPTFEEVDSYVKEKNYHFSSIEFYAYYANNDWRLSNGRKMKDWRYACVTFECKEMKWKKQK